MAGLLFFLIPPRRSLGKAGNLVCLCLLLLAFSGFMPVDWFPIPGWRSVLRDQFGVSLPGVRSPQPWLTLESALLLLWGVAWGYFLLAHSWSERAQGKALRIFGAGILVVAAFAVDSYFRGYKVAFWPLVLNLSSDFGFFPNRNQTANVLALSGIIVASIAYEDIQLRRKISGLWFVGLGLITVALVLATSRAGILLFFGGTTVWALAALRLSRSGKYLALTATSLLLLLTAFFLFGGGTLKRFQPATLDPRQDFRMLIQQDALKLSLQSPWLGSGLGNFEPLFRLTRQKSNQQNRVIHPESDWLWLATEMGWAAPLAIFGGLALWLKRCLPFEGKRSVVRMAAAVCGIAFVLHGFIDVSGHRLGSVCPALYIMSNALNPARKGGTCRWVAPAFRCVGLLLLVIAGCWIAAVRGAELFPTSETMKRLRSTVDIDASQNDYAQVIDATSVALKIAPLDWRFYTQRAIVEAKSYATSAAINDFRIARFLQPSWIQTCIYEGQVWLEMERPEYALEAWGEALRRSGGGEAGCALFQYLLTQSASKPEVRNELREWTRDNPSYLIPYLATAGPWEFKGELDILLFEHPDLGKFSAKDRQALFFLWELKGDANKLTEALLSHPEWQQDGWRFLAQYYAKEKEYRRAYEIVRQFGEKPVLPKIESQSSRSDLELEFILNPESVAKGLAAYGAQLNERRFQDALRTVRALHAGNPRLRYLSAMEAEVHAHLGDWENAWAAWQVFTADPGG